MKNPWVAALLNFFFFGLGTLYAAQRPKLAAVLVTLGGSAVQVLEIKMSPPFDNWGYWPWFFTGLVLVKIGLAIDGYQSVRSRP